MDISLQISMIWAKQLPVAIKTFINVLNIQNVMATG